MKKLINNNNLGWLLTIAIALGVFFGVTPSLINGFGGYDDLTIFAGIFIFILEVGIIVLGGLLSAKFNDWLKEII